MKYIKQYENMDIDLYLLKLKKYILLNINSLSIYEIISDSIMKVDDEFTVTYKVDKLCDVTENTVNTVLKQSNKFGSRTFTKPYLIKNLIEQSDDAEKLLEIAKLYIQTTKYNL